ncbi:caprin-2-like [Crassostrea virginica]
MPPENVLLSDIDVKNLMQRLVALEESLAIEKERNDQLERSVNSLITELAETKRTFNDKCSTLEKQLQEHHKEDKDMRRKRNDSWWKPKHSALTKQDSSKATVVTRTMHSENSQKRLLIQPSQITPTTVAFYAQKSSSIPASEATGNRVLVFDIVKTNLGNGYHPSTGVFMVPESGIYVFSWSFRNGLDDYHSTELMVNTGQEGIIYIDSADGSYITGTGIAVIHVNKGDDVYVRIGSLGNRGPIYSDARGRCSFTGWKLN